jgi:hypothetical protein
MTLCEGGCVSSLISQFTDHDGQLIERPIQYLQTAKHFDMGVCEYRWERHPTNYNSISTYVYGGDQFWG